TTQPVDSAVAVDILGTINGVGCFANLHVTPPTTVDLRDLSIYPVCVTGGNPSTGSLTLQEIAPPGGVLVRLSTGHPQAARVPATVTVPAGARTITFPITTFPVAFEIDTVVRANTAFDTEAKYIFVKPPTGLRLNSLTLNPATVKGGLVSTGTITLNA